jgi:hypothetical protein
MTKPPTPSNEPEREPPNWFVFPIAAAILIAIVVTYRFACSTY